MKSEYESALGYLTLLALAAAGYAFYALDTVLAASLALPGILVIYLALLFGVTGLLGLNLSSAKKEEVGAHVRTHLGALSRNLRQSVKKNDYGLVLADERDDCVRDFLDSVELSFDYRRIEPAVIDFVLAEVERLEDKARAGGFDPDCYPQDPAEFEHWCAEQLRRFGWEADVTQRGYDQGIDIVARKGTLVIGLQVKRYNTPVGNKAIQEAIAGKSYYGLAGAGVLATSGFTPSARRLASSTDVALLSPYDIPNLGQSFRYGSLPIEQAL
ncbi:restriction endonuclease [Salipiger mucosus]|uniref:Putative Mrr-like endonuclease n=1 Tax=Salipiger mucosus DSM 16094 TaxID=1123237 RepID=S9RVW0_9RHOB|nr:restriction endonuclease [Salipiger mucosus]EPX78104.1 putative Mrr-like endonuclease [Salipiger mucosus DSM 16094]